jgi:hypothetical protein
LKNITSTGIGNAYNTMPSIQTPNLNKWMEKYFAEGQKS